MVGEKIREVRRFCGLTAAHTIVYIHCLFRAYRVEENKTFPMERAHLSDLMSTVQKMHNNLERFGENDRRRLENQLQTLESQT